MPRPTESSVESAILRGAERLGIRIVLKLANRANSGWPDRLFLLPGGRPVFIEIKRPGAQPRSLQTYRLRQLVKQGYDAAWFDNADDAVCYLAGKMAAPRGPEEGC